MLDLMDDDLGAEQCIPSNLDGPDEEVATKWGKAIRDGITSDKQIRGSSLVDFDAQRGAKFQKLPGIEADLAQDRMYLAALLQRHLVLSWDRWVQHSTDRNGIADVDVGFDECGDPHDTTWIFQDDLIDAPHAGGASDDPFFGADIDMGWNELPPRTQAMLNGPASRVIGQADASFSSPEGGGKRGWVSLRGGGF